MKKKNADYSQRYEELLDTAVALFEEKGYSSTTMRDIAKKMNLTQGSLYYYIKKKRGPVISNTPYYYRNGFR